MSRHAHLTVLIDNTSDDPALAHEWGLAMVLDLPGGERWLWDTGASRQCVDNARKLGIDLKRAEGVALSHGHYDHTGGLRALFGSGFAGAVVAHPGFDVDRYSLGGPGAAARPIGNPPEMPRPLPRFLGIEDRREIAPGLTFLTGMERRPGRFTAVGGFFLDPEGRAPDPVADDALLVVEAAGWRTVVLGCCHAGLANSLEHVSRQLGVERIDIVAGGLHLHDADERAIEESAQALERFGVHRIHAGHCTGEAAVRALRERLGDHVFPLGSGRKIPLG
jgi:7,8-dihydropterin-6-yl-methyl-4-(beta-D-ribofuranosyl)aminobenzene 5'-phosphate synthase